MLVLKGSSVAGFGSSRSRGACPVVVVVGELCIPLTVLHEQHGIDVNNVDDV